MKRQTLTIVVLLSVMFVLWIIRSVMLDNLDINDGIYAVVKTEIDTVSKENELLNEQLLRASSLTIIAQKASKLGFIPDKNPVYLINKKSPK